MKERRILVINPNTSESSTKRMQDKCREIAFPGTKVDAVNPPARPGFEIPSIGAYVDEAVCAPEAIKIAWRERNNYDGMIVACFSDPGLDAIKELLDIPVIGIGEMAYHAAALLGHKFSILTVDRKWTPPKENYVKSVGVESKVASIFPRVEARSPIEPTEQRKQLIEAGKKAIQDGAEVVILGCADDIGYALGEDLGIPVIEPTAVALKFMEALLMLGLKQSKICRWKQPPESAGPIKYDRGLE